MHFGIAEKPTRDCIYIIMVALSLKFPKKYPAKTLKIAVIDVASYADAV